MLGAIAQKIIRSTDHGGWPVAFRSQAKKIPMTAPMSAAVAATIVRRLGKPATKRFITREKCHRVSDARRTGRRVAGVEHQRLSSHGWGRYCPLGQCRPMMPR